MLQKNYQNEIKDALDNPSIDKTNGIVRIGNLYFASARTYDVFQKSFKQILGEVDQETASDFAKKALDIAYAPNYNTLVALNNHDKGTNECRDVTNRLFTQPIWDQLWEGVFQKGMAHTRSNSEYAVICWDNKYNFLVDDEIFFVKLVIAKASR